MKSSKGFTLLELLCVTVIVGVLSSLLFPVFQSAMVAARRTNSTAMMKQAHQALIIYADDGGAEERLMVGLPGVQGQGQILRKHPEFVHTGGFPNREGEPNSDVRTFFASDQDGALPSWQEHVRATTGNPVVIGDSTFGFKPLYEAGIFEAKRAHAIFFDGHVVTKIRSGEPGSFDFWEEKKQ